MTCDPLEQASHTLDRMAARLEIIARAWRAEADHMRNGDRSLLAVNGVYAVGVEARYADAASRSLLRGLSSEVDAITRTVRSEIASDPWSDPQSRDRLARLVDTLSPRSDR